MRAVAANDERPRRRDFEQGRIGARGAEHGPRQAASVAPRQATARRRRGSRTPASAVAITLVVAIPATPQPPRPSAFHMRRRRAKQRVGEHRCPPTPVLSRFRGSRSCGRPLEVRQLRLRADEDRGGRNSRSSFPSSGTCAKPLIGVADRRDQRRLLVEQVRDANQEAEVAWSPEPRPRGCGRRRAAACRPGSKVRREARKPTPSQGSCSSVRSVPPTSCRLWKSLVLLMTFRP